MARVQSQQKAWRKEAPKADLVECPSQFSVSTLQWSSELPSERTSLSNDYRIAS